MNLPLAFNQARVAENYEVTRLSEAAWRQIRYTYRQSRAQGCLDHPTKVLAVPLFPNPVVFLITAKLLSLDFSLAISTECLFS